MSEAAERGESDLPTDEDMRRFRESPLGRSIENARSDPADVFQVSEEHPSGVVIGLRLNKNPAMDRRGSLGKLYERIADPARPFPFDREFAVKRWELLAWLDGRSPGYCPSLIERQVILPAYRERLRREAEAKRRGNPSPLEPEQDENTRPSVGKVVEGIANLLNHGANLPAADRVSAAMLELFNSDREEFGAWTMEQWAKYCTCSKKTISKTPAWREIMAWKEQNKLSRKADLVSPETGKKIIPRKSL